MIPPGTFAIARRASYPAMMYPSKDVLSRFQNLAQRGFDPTFTEHQSRPSRESIIQTGMERRVLMQPADLSGFFLPEALQQLKAARRVRPALRFRHKESLGRARCGDAGELGMTSLSNWFRRQNALALCEETDSADAVPLVSNNIRIWNAYHKGGENWFMAEGIRLS